MDGFGVGLQALLGQLAATGGTIGQTVSVAEFDAEGHLVSANQGYATLFGMTPDRAAGIPHGLTRVPELAACVRGGPGHGIARQDREEDAGTALWTRLLSQHVTGGLYRREAADGTARYLHAVHVIQRETSGPVRVTEYATDATHRHLRFAELESWIGAIDSSSAVLRLDLQGMILDANAMFLDAMGYTLDDVRGRHHRMFVEPSHAHGAEYAAFWNALVQGRHQAGQFRRIARGGREVWVQAAYNPVLGPEGRPNGVVAFATVVTEEKLRQAAHQGQIAAIDKALCVISFDLDGTILDANDNFLDAMGYRLAEVRGRHHAMFVGDEVARSESYTAFWTALAAGVHQSGEYRRIDHAGRDVWLQATYNPILDLNGRPFRVVKYATVVTAEKLRRADHEGQIAAIRQSQGVISFALDGTILEANDAFLQPLGYTLDEVVGRHHSMFVGPALAASSDYETLWDTLRSGTFVSGLYRRLGKGGHVVWIQASYNPIRDLAGRPCKIVKIASDVTRNVALAEAYEDARKQSQLDPATALPNRHRLLGFMQDVLADPARRLVLLYLDLDRFKPVNDTYGHDVGDHVLAQVADRLRRALGREQLAARLGGDEFVIAAPDLGEDEIAPFADALIGSLKEPILHKGVEIRIGVSIGVATSQDSAVADELLRCADIALYRSKTSNRGGVSFYAASLHDRLLAFRTLVQEIHTGLVEEQFFIEFQPRFDTGTRTIKSVEALIRWNHPTRGLVPPSAFIPAAEKSGLITQLGAWVLDEACAAAARWPRIGVSVNVSAVQFGDGRLVETVTRALSRSGLDAARLELEVTESILLADADRARSTLIALKALGVRIAMDDFGTGYSSLSSLRTFPFDVIKIDRQFISDMDGVEGGRETVQAILGLGRALGLSVTAEGVESGRQLDMLTADQCEEVQGFLLARPMSERAVAQLLTTASGENKRRARRVARTVRDKVSV